MQIRYFIFLFFTLATAQMALAKPSSSDLGYRFVMLSGGLESRLERNQEQNIVDRVLPSYAIGIGYSDFVFSAEYASFKESTGQNSLTVDRTVENYMLWGTWSAGEWSSFIPYLGVGAGQSVETIDTTLLGSKSRDKGKPQVLGGGAIGIRANMPILWLILEARVTAAERGDPNPTAGFVGRLGFYF